jgi:outer membrane protein assembly factor BamB
VAEGALPARLAVLWKYRAGDAIDAAVAVEGGVVYVGSADTYLHAVDLAKGRRKWRYRTGKDDDSAAPIKAAPAVRGGEVFVGDQDGKLHCVDAAKGKRRWVFEAGAEVGGINFHGQEVLFTSHDENLYCLTKAGKKRWKFKVEGPVYGSPAVAEGKTYLVGCDSKLHVIDVASGKADRSVELRGQTGASAAVLGGQLYVGTMRNEVKAINWKRGDVAWNYRAPRAREGFFSSPAVTEKYVVLGSRDEKVYALYRKSGKRAWSFPTGGKVDSSPVIAGSRVVFGSFDGRLYLLALSSGRRLQALSLDGPVVASPVVVGGKVLVGTQKGTLYCLGEKE